MSEDKVIHNGEHREADVSNDAFSANDQFLEKIILKSTEVAFLFRENRGWYKFFEHMGHKVEEVERAFIEIIHREYPQLRVRKGTILVPTVPITGNLPTSEGKRVDALWIGKPAEAYPAVYLVKAVHFGTFGTGLRVEMYDLVPATRGGCLVPGTLIRAEHRDPEEDILRQAVERAIFEALDSVGITVDMMREAQEPGESRVV